MPTLSSPGRRCEMRFYLTQFIDFIPANWEFWRRIEGDLGCEQVCKKEFVTGLSVIILIIISPILIIIIIN